MKRLGQNVRPRCLVVASPNGTGKTTFAREFLPNEARVLNFVNADLIAGRLSPFKPELAAIAAGRLVLKEMISRLVEARADFAFESTLSGLGYITRLREIKQSGYHIEIIYLRIFSPHLAMKRIKSRVKLWAVYDNSTRPPKLIASGP